MHYSNGSESGDYNKAPDIGAQQYRQTTARSQDFTRDQTTSRSQDTTRDQYLP